MYKKLIKISFVLIGLLILILTISPLFFNKDKIVSLAQKKISNELNLDLTFDKDINLILFPFPKLIVKNVFFNDDQNYLEVKIIKAELVSSWKSLINLNPEFKSLELISPTIKIKKKIAFNNNLILIGNHNKTFAKKLKSMISILDNLRIKDGRADFYRLDVLNSLNNIDLFLTSSDQIKIDAEFDYENYKSFFKVKAKTTDLKNFKYSVNQLFENKNELLNTGTVLYDENDISIKGEIYSNQLNFYEIAKLFSQFNKLYDQKIIHSVNTRNPGINFDFDLEIDKILFNDHKLKNISSKLYSAKNEFFIKDLRIKYLESSINANAIYSIKNKNVKGKISIFDYLVDQNFLGSSNFDISDASFDCDVFFTINSFKRIRKILDEIYAEGSCNSDSARLIGIDIEKISNGLDNLETFQDFFNLFNKEKMKGTTKIDNLDLKFSLKNSIFFINEFVAKQTNIKVQAAGQYDLNKNLINIKNDVFIKTKKFNNLPSFIVLVNGTPEKYNLSYDFEKIKSAVLTNGINSILKKKKKIVIDPKSLKGLIDKKKEFNPEKIIDLFLN